MIYLDNAATTPVCREAADAALEAMTSLFGNPSSLHAPGRAARQKLAQARQTLAQSLGAQPEEIYFTSGGTEGDNWALVCGARQQRHVGKHILSSRTEHDAVRKTLDMLGTQGWEITLLDPDPDGSIHPEAVAAALRPDTALVSLMYVNNETGSITDIPAISRVLRSAGSRALLHTDAIQAYMKIPFTVKELGADLVTISGHKIGAPKGIGAQYVRAGLHLPPLLWGGGQEKGERSGTENMPGICALAAAAEAARRDPQASNRMQTLRLAILDTLRPALPDLTVIGGGSPHILCLSLPGYRSEVLLNALDARGICISKGSACKRGARSHVLEAMKLPAKVIDGAIRVSLSRFTTREETDAFCQALLQTARSLCKSL